MAKLPTPAEAKARFEQNKIAHSKALRESRQRLKDNILNNAVSYLNQSLDFPVCVRYVMHDYEIDIARQLWADNFEDAFRDAGYNVFDVKFDSPSNPWQNSPPGSLELNFKIEPL